MLKELSLLAFTALAPGGATIIGSTAAPIDPVCGPKDDAYAQEFMGYARNVTTKPRNAALRSALGLPTVDSGELVFVQVDSVCMRAAAAINRDRGSSGKGPQRVYTLKVGNVYWVEDPTYKAGEYIAGLVVDSTFTKILGRPGR